MSPPTSTTRSRYAAGAAAGLLAGAAGVAAAEAVSALLTGVTSPLLAVANRAVDATPRPVKEWAIETFGSADKTVLISGVIATVAGLAVLAGVLGVRRRALAVGLFLVLTAVATAAALTDRAATASPATRLLPVLALGVVGLVSLVTLLRPVPPRVRGDELPAGFDRRAFLRTAMAVGTVAAAGGLTSRFAGGAAAAASRAGVRIPVPTSAAPPVPAGATLDVAGITPYLTPNKDFYRVDTALRVPDVPVDDFTLRIHGMVDQELELSFEDLLSRRLVERRITLTCVSNPVGGDLMGNATWIGVPLHELLEEAGIQDGADAVKSTSADDFTIGTPLPVLLDADREALLAVAMNGKPLPLEHGFPVRMVTPGLYGYVSATKWLVDLEVTRFADFKAYWTTRGYSAEAPIKTSSRIDVPRSFAKVKAGRTPVAGVAWSQDRGIEDVEVRVDDGPWNRARLAAPDNVNTWRQWVWEWEAEPGNHKLEVRATDSTGYTQTSRRAPIAPDGSTGWDSVDVTVE
ncbi:MAG TPA: molybdopterin-dependent oxidoreductase [Nocardioidaceae bacterium]|nr:molybdopterin-dependent oxidoreductase [Nocardioidaceae bacterium]